jgi:hypothetical protein
VAVGTAGIERDAGNETGSDRVMMDDTQQNTALKTLTPFVEGSGLLRRLARVCELAARSG